MAKQKPTKRKNSTVMVFDQAKHYLRFARSERGEKPAAIARSEGVSVRAVEKSIRQVALQMGVYTQQNLNMAMIGVLMNNMRHVDSTFKSLFAAKQYLERKHADGSSDFLPVEDKPMQLEALKVYGTYMASMQPRAAGVSLNVQQNNSNQANAVLSGTGSYEEMLHRIMKDSSSFNQLPPKTADVIDAVEQDEEDDDEVLTAR